MNLNLKYRFLIPVVILMVAGMGISSTISYISARNALRNAITAQVDQIAVTTVKNIDSWIADRALDVKTWSQQTVYQRSMETSFVGRSAQRAAGRYLSDLKQDYSYYEQINLADNAGSLVASSEPLEAGALNVSREEFFRQAMAGNPSVSQVTKSTLTGNPVFFIASPIQTADGIAGVMWTVVDMSRLSALFVDPVKISESGYAFLLDRDGRVIASPDRSQILSTNMGNTDYGEEILSRKQGSITYHESGQAMLAAFETSDNLGWTVTVTADQDDVLAPVHRLGMMSMTVSLVVILLAVIITLMIVQLTVRSLNAIIAGLTEASDQVASASEQISASSQSLAQGTSQQAASLEEVSASLEEMSTMTRQNAENARQADIVADEAMSSAGKGVDAMTRMLDAINRIKTSSDETAKIIKNIDEIAFQTNLLALNAAVEAARAGDAGLGFAVVADEVRNLALRSAEAARNTAKLIDESKVNADNGVTVTKEVEAILHEISERVSKVTTLIREVSTASEEQTNGIAGVNTSVAQMDKVTQASAANAEETASASEELSTQANELNNMLAILIDIVGGRRDTQADLAPHHSLASGIAGGNGFGKFLPAMKPRPSVRQRTVPTKPVRSFHTNGNGRMKAPSPENLIPLDEESDFVEF